MKSASFLSSVCEIIGGCAGNTVGLSNLLIGMTIEEAIKRADIYQDIANMQDGLETKIGENGMKVSGGQKQRIALARALIRGIDFLILDEGVSAVDVETANEIEQRRHSGFHPGSRYSFRSAV